MCSSVVEMLSLKGPSSGLADKLLKSKLAFSIGIINYAYHMTIYLQ